MKTLSTTERTISSETLKDVLKYVPKDGFKLTDDVLNKVYTVIDVEEYPVGDIKTFSATLESEDGHTITLSASALKRSRVITSDGVKVDKFYKTTKNVVMRSEADAIFSGSAYFHREYKMSKEEDFVLPGKLKLRYAILSEDQETGEPLINPYLYKDFRKVVREYSKKGDYPTMDDFREELRKTESEGRFPFLSKSTLKPEPYSWVKNEVSDFRHVLVFEKV